MPLERRNLSRREEPRSLSLAKRGQGEGEVGALEAKSGSSRLTRRMQKDRGERAREDLVYGRAGPPLSPPFARVGKGRNELGMKAQLVRE